MSDTRIRLGPALGTAALLLATALGPVAQADPNRPVHLIWMGGNDCPPCVAWRATELPKLKATEAFRESRFSYVVKSIRSTVPSATFLPEEVKPYKADLDAANNGRSGSPQAVLLVDGKVYDYFTGTRTAEQVEAMLKAARAGGAYPFKRCLKLGPRGQPCLEPV